MTTTRRYVKNEKGYEKSVKADWDAVKKEAESRGIPYQTLIGSLLHRYSNGELVDKKIATDIVSLKSA